MPRIYTGKYCERCDKLGFDKCHCARPTHQPLTAAQLTESTIIIPAEIWRTLPSSVTDVLYGYIGTPVKNSKTGQEGYKFVVPQYRQDQLLEEWGKVNQLTEGDER